ncbi:MAG TPA: hypothetical protein ENN40_02270 [Candidatus Aminicenantes bacterium]|nr:hypothetical protein [Candidatus Aminicenantes bacterium]
MKVRPVILVILLMIVSPVAGQDQPAIPKCAPLFIKATFYPTYSLSRYDYDIDRNRQELRAYIELRQGGIHGDAVRDARILVNGTPIDYNDKEKDYRRRILIQQQDNFSRDILLEIQRPDGCRIREEVNFPGWVKISDPAAKIVEINTSIPVRWTFSSHPFPLVLHIFDFKQRQKLLRRRLDPGDSAHLPQKDIPKNSILRIWITSDWFFKKYLSGKHIVRGSEINILPWSQVFVRTRSTKTEP